MLDNACPWEALLTPPPEPPDPSIVPSDAGDGSGHPRQSDRVIAHGRAGRQGSQTQSLVLASLGQGGDLAARTKACLPGQEDANRRLAEPCGIHPQNHNGQLVPGLSSWGHPGPSAVNKASRGWGNRQGNLCPWQGQTLVHACGSAEAAWAEWWPQGCPQPHSGNGECVTFHGKGDFRSLIP